jgi:hypothetical protein
MSKEQLSKLIYDQLQTEFRNEKDRVANPASEYNQIHANNLATPIFTYLDTVYWDRIVAYIEPIRQTATRALSLPAPGSGPPGPPGPPGPAGTAGHTDTVPHTDTPHTDGVYPPAHSDAIPHSDIPHVDAEIVPHVDGYTPHVDMGSGGGGGGDNNQIQPI